MSSEIDPKIEKKDLSAIIHLYLRERYPILSKISDEMIIDKIISGKKSDQYQKVYLHHFNMIIKGKTQVGKTGFIVHSVFDYIFRGQSVIVILRNANDDLIQFERRCNAYVGVLEDYLRLLEEFEPAKVRNFYTRQFDDAMKQAMKT